MLGDTDLIRAIRTKDAKHASDHLRSSSVSAVNLQNCIGETALHIACRGTFDGSGELAVDLLRQGANVGAISTAGLTPVDEATAGMTLEALDAERRRCQAKVPSVAPLFASRLMKQSRVPGGKAAAH